MSKRLIRNGGVLGIVLALVIAFAGCAPLADLMRQDQAAVGGPPIESSAPAPQPIAPKTVLVDTGKAVYVDAVTGALLQLGSTDVSPGAVLSGAIEQARIARLVAAQKADSPLSSLANYGAYLMLLLLSGGAVVLRKKLANSNQALDITTAAIETAGDAAQALKGAVSRKIQLKSDGVRATLDGSISRAGVATGG